VWGKFAVVIVDNLCFTDITRRTNISAFNLDTSWFHDTISDFKEATSTTEAPVAGAGGATTIAPPKAFNYSTLVYESPFPRGTLPCMQTTTSSTTSTTTTSTTRAPPTSRTVIDLTNIDISMYILKYRYIYRHLKIRYIGMNISRVKWCRCFHTNHWFIINRTSKEENCCN